MSVFLGAIKGSALGKYEKIDFLEAYYNLIRLGFPKNGAFDNVMSKWAFIPNLYDEKKPKFKKLIEKNSDIIDKLASAEKYVFPERLMILK
jgi:hypothetical protein